MQFGGCLPDDLADVVEPISARSQGLERFMRQGRQMRVTSGDIWWIACNQVKVTTDFFQPVTMDK